MATLYLVRHGEADAGWQAARNPGLSDKGREHARIAGSKIMGMVAAPAPILSSPLKRCLETARPLADLWGRAPVITSEFAEIITPKDLPLVERGDWLKKIFPLDWTGFLTNPALSGGADFKGWRQRMIDAARNLEGAHIIFSHFIAINVLVGAACGDDRIISRRPAYGSIWVFEQEGDALRLAEAGAELDTRVL